MNYLIQRGKIRSQVINVPEGLPELLSDVTREVLRCQPTTECLCQFIIDYLHSLIVTRDKARMAKMIIDRALRTVDEVIADMCICDIDMAKAGQMSIAMEECFQRFLGQRRCAKGKNIELVKFNEFDMLDELMQKCKFSEDELQISRPIIEAAYKKFVDAYISAQENTEGTEALYQYFRDRELKRIEDRVHKEAAIKIQASFRGFLVRRSLFIAKDVKKPVEEAYELSESVLEHDVAARKIQRFFRHRMSFVRKQAENAVEQAMMFQDVCQPESIVSLTAHSPGLPDIKKDTANPLFPEEGHYNKENLITYQEAEVNKTPQTEIHVGHSDEEDNQIDATTVMTTETHQEAIVDGEVVHTHEESHTITEKEHAPDVNAEE